MIAHEQKQIGRKEIRGWLRIAVLLIPIVIQFSLVSLASGKESQEIGGGCPTILTYGNTIHCTLDFAGETDSFTFTASVGDRVYVRVVKTVGAMTPFQEIIRPGGTSLCKTIIGEISCVIDSEGTHTLLINDFGGTDTGAYSLYIQKLNDPVGCTAISFGNPPTSGAIPETGGTYCFTFSLETNDRVRSLVVKTSGTITPFEEIVRPDGTTLCENIVGEISCTADIAGSYTLLINDFGGTDIGDYALYVQRLNLPVGCTAISFSGLPSTGTITAAAETDCFTFNGKAGDQIRVRVVKTAGAITPFQEVVTPDGTTLCKTIVSEATCQIQSDGPHTILVNDFGNTDSGTYQLTLLCLTAPCGLPLTIFTYLPFIILDKP